MDKKSPQPIRSGHVAMMETKKRATSPTFGLKHAVSEGENKIQKWSFFREREREHLLSKIPGDRTVGFLRAKKESCSTRRGLHVGTDLGEF